MSWTFFSSPGNTAVSLLDEPENNCQNLITCHFSKPKNG